MQPIVMDMDMGPGDALALLLALRSPDLDVLGVSVVDGETDVATGAYMVLRLLQAAGHADTPVHIGAAGAERASAGDQQHSILGRILDGIGLGDPDMLPAGDAADLLAAAIRARPGAVVVIATGPLTNLANLESRAPGTLKRARRIVVCGGAMGTPGTAAAAADLQAVDRVTQSGANVTVVPASLSVEVASGSVLAEQHPKAARSTVGGLVLALIDALPQSRTVGEAPPRAVHDPLAVALAAQPALIVSAEEGAAISAKRGRLPQAPSAVEYVSQVDEERSRQLLLQRLLPDG